MNHLAETILKNRQENALSEIQAKISELKLEAKTVNDRLLILYREETEIKDHPEQYFKALDKARGNY
jgi:hypothetical protein